MRKAFLPTRGLLKLGMPQRVRVTEEAKVHGGREQGVRAQLSCTKTNPPTQVLLSLPNAITPLAKGKCVHR